MADTKQMASCLRGETIVLAALLLIAPVIAGCPPKMVHIPEANAFAQNLFRIVREDRVAEWGTQLTAQRREMGKPYIQKHYDSWRTLLLQLERSFGEPVEKVQFRVNNNALEFMQNKKWTHLFRVTMEDGGLKINQD